MATNLNISENQERVPLRIGGGGLLRTISPDNGSPYYVGARAYVTQTAGGAIVTVIDKDGTTTATILNGTNGQNGVSISDISLTGSSGLVDTYTITYSNGDTDTFTVTNGQDGADGNDGYSPTATVTKSGDTATITITDINGTTTATVKDGTQANAFTAEFGTTTYADVKDAYDDDAILICTVPDGDNTMTLQLVYFDVANEIFFFAFPISDGWYWTQLSNANGWEDGQFYFASTDVATQLADGLMSALDKQKLDGIASGAEVNVQSDWNQSTNTADDYIKNKPTIPSNVSDLVNDSGFITSPNVVYCTCSTASGTAAKVATIESGSLTSLNKGDQAIVKFTNANGVASPTLQVGTTTAKSIKRYGTTAPSTSAATSWNAGSAVYFVYDGTYWQQIGFLNSTYSEISEANITNGTGSSTGLASGRRVKKAVETFAPVKSVNGSTGAVTLTIPADTSDLTNGAGFITSSALPSDFVGTDGVDDGTAGLVPAPTTSDTDKYLKSDGTWATVSGGGGGGEIVYCTCTDSASTVAKTATVVSGTFSSLTTGSQVAVKFTYTNTATNPTLNVAGTGAKGIRRGGTAYVGTNANESWNAGTVVFLLYDGTDWQIVGWLNTTYGGGTGAEIIAGTSALNKVWSPQQIHDGISGMLPTVPTVNDATLTIQKNSTNVATFTANASSNVTADISVPTDTGDLTNGAGFITSSDIPVTDVTLDGTSVVSNGVAALTNPTDYIVEQGNLTDGFYRKWNSGKAEVWYAFSSASGLTTTSWVSPVAYADFSSFSSIWDGVFNAAPPCVTCTSNNSQVFSVYPYTITSTGISSLRVLTLNAKSNIAYSFSVYAVGTWK